MKHKKYKHYKHYPMRRLQDCLCHYGLLLITSLVNLTIVVFGPALIIFILIGKMVGVIYG